MRTDKALPISIGLILGTSLTCLLSPGASGHTIRQAGQSHKTARRAAAAEAGVDLPNFGRINDHYCRGAQPLPRQYDDLAAIGVKTIVDLRDDIRPYAKEAAERAGLMTVSLLAGLATSAPASGRMKEAQSSRERIRPELEMGEKMGALSFGRQIFRLTLFCRLGFSGHNNDQGQKVYG